MRKIIYGVLALMLVLVALYKAPALSAEGTGADPTNGIYVDVAAYQICTTQSLAPGASMWIKLPYHTGTDVLLTTNDTGYLDFQVYYDPQVSGFPALGTPVGLMTFNRNIVGGGKSWLGHVATSLQNAYIYVLVVNPTSVARSFSFCTIQTPIFVPPAGGLPNLSPIVVFCPPGFIFTDGGCYPK